MIKEGWKHAPGGGHFQDSCFHCGQGVQERWLYEGCMAPLPEGRPVVWRLSHGKFQVGVFTGYDPRGGLLVSWNLSSGEVDSGSISAEDVVTYLVGETNARNP